jgi:Cu-Zn family superoxide dismutase
MHFTTLFAISALSSLAASQACTPRIHNDRTEWPIKAVATITGDKVKGTVNLVQDSATADVKITYSISGLDPNSQRGFHIHQLGDLSKGCAGAGGHFNPFQKDHGSPTDVNRHVGDLGNIASDASGNANGTITDSQVKLRNIAGVIGRSIVVHAGTDDLGKGAAESKKTGNAGSRSGCGVIGRA